jgi:hypothetical protein
VTTGELTEYGNRFGLSRDQRRAVESLHDEYKREFRILRDGDIARFMKQMRTLWGGAAGGMPSRATLEEFFEELEKLQGRIAAVDGRLFDRVQPLLTEDQLATMPRIRERRERQRFGSMAMFNYGQGTAVDMSEICWQTGLTPEEWAAVDPSLAQYEHRLTAAMRKQYEISTSFYTRMLDALEEVGITEETWQDPDNLQEVQTAAQGIMANLMGDILKASEKTYDLNRRTLSGLQLQLVPENYRKVRDAFVQGSYPELSQIPLGSRMVFKSALGLQDLTDAQRAELEALQASTEALIDDLLASAMKEMDDMRGDIVKMMSGDMGYWQERQEKIQKMQTEAQETIAGRLEGVIGILGEELAAQAHLSTGMTQATLQAFASGAMVVPAATATVAAEAVETAEADAHAAYTHGFGDQFLPPRLSKTHLTQYAEILELDENERIIAEALLETYEEPAQASLWEWDQTTGQMTSLPDRAKIKRVYDLRREALEGMRRADEAFFAELDESLLMGRRDEQLNRVRLTRERETWTRGSMMLGGFGGQNEPNVDLISLVKRQRWDDDTMLDEPLFAYLKKITPVLRERYDVALEYQQGSEVINAEQQRMMQEGGEATSETYQKMWQELMGSSGKRAAELGEQIGVINRKTLERLQAKLPEMKSHQLQQEYRRQAFPAIYVDAMSVQKQLRSAATLGDLTATQRTRLDQLLASYVPDYERMCDEMVEASSGAQPYWWGGAESIDWAEYQEKQQKVERLRFDRDELNARAVSRLKDILSDEQIVKVGGLPDAKVTQTTQWYGG